MNSKYEDFLEELRKTIREVREEKGISQEIMAEKLNISPRTMGRYETEKNREIPLRVLFGYWQQLGVPLYRLWGIEENENSQYTQDLCKEFNELCSKFNELCSKFNSF